MTMERRYPHWFQLFFWLATVLSIPLLPFLAIGWYLEPQIEHWLASLWQWPLGIASVAIISLSADIFLPIPSSFVCTTAGQILGIPIGTAVCTTGLQLGAGLGWFAGRKFGSVWIERCCGKAILDVGIDALEKWGYWAIILSRPVPLVAEAIVLLLGTHPDNFEKWLPVLMLSNFSIALAWCSLGQISRDQHWTWLASLLSVILPVLLLSIVRLFRKGES